MTESIASGAAKLFIKLFDGKNIDLNALNSLVEKECNDSIFKNWELKNGSGDSIFSQEEVNLLRTQLYQKYVDDGNLSQEDLDDIFGKNDNGESSVDKTALHESFRKLQGEKPSLELQDETQFQNPDDTRKPDETKEPDADKKAVETPQTGQEPETEEDKNKAYTNYIIQNGDTPQKIVAKLKLQGEEAEKVLRELKEALGNRKFFLIGEVVKLSGDYQQKIAEMSDYKTDKDEIKNDYKKDRARKEAMRKAAKESLEENSKTETKKTVQPQKPQKPQKPQIPAGVQNYINKLKSKNIDYKLNKNSDGSYSIIQKSGFKDPNITQAVRTYDKSGNVISHTQSYKNGDVRGFQYDKSGKEFVQTLLKSNGDLLVGMPNEQGKITSLKKVFNLKDNKSSISVTKHNDGSFDIVEKRDSFAKEGVVSKIYKFDKTGKHFKTTVVVKPKQKGKSQPVKPTWKDNKVQKQEKRSLSQASLIPGLENIGSNPMAPKSEEDLIKYINTNEYQYPEKMRMCIAELRASGIECKNITKNKNGNYTVTLNDQNCLLVQYNKNLYNNTAITFDSNGNLIKTKNNNTVLGFSQTKNFKNGKTVKEEHGFSLKAGYSELDTQRTYNDNVPIDIHISIPEHYKNDKDVKDFTNSLKKNKADLMKTLGITNKQYDRLVSIAMSIAENEKHFNNIVITDTEGKKHLTGLRRFEKWGAEQIGVLEGPNHSWGITQINWTKNMEGEKEPAPYLRKQAKKFGITSYKDYKDNPEKAAILTMIILNNKRILADGEEWQKRLEENNAMIDADPKLSPEEKARKKLTPDDIIALQYNGIGGIMPRFLDPNQYVTIDDENSGKRNANGDKIKDGLSYAKAVRAYRKEFFVVKQEETSRKKVQNVNADLQNNNGSLGKVIFMPTKYNDEKPASEDEIKLLTNVLNSKTNIDQKLKDDLLEAVKNGEISFGYGLTLEEAQSLTKNDIKLLLSGLRKMKSQMEGLSPKEIRDLSKKTSDEFQSQYLESKQVIVNDLDVDENSIIYAMRNPNEEKTDNNRQSNVKKAHLNGKQQGHAEEVAASSAASEAAGTRYGFMVEHDKGVNPYDSKGNLIPAIQIELAENGAVVSRDMGTGGNCLTGVKLALENTGVVKKGEVVYPAGHPKAGRPIRHAKDLKLFFDAHPEKFQQVKYISIGGNKSREMNTSDIRNLPAGYIGIFIPGPGYEDQSGHAFITNGNGQGYSDEVDNLRWDDFKSGGDGNGKGEHGKFVIYKIKV